VGRPSPEVARRRCYEHGLLRARRSDILAPARGGQILHATSGEGMVVTRDGSAARVRAGDVVWAPPGEEHWHGARSDTFFVHTTASVGAAAWLDEVTPEDYGQSQQRD